MKFVQQLQSLRRFEGEKMVAFQVLTISEASERRDQRELVLREIMETLKDDLKNISKGDLREHIRAYIEQRGTLRQTEERDQIKLEEKERKLLQERKRLNERRLERQEEERKKREEEEEEEFL